VIVPEISKLENFDIVFGACRNLNFLSTDVSPMSLKDIRIFNPKNELLYHWKLSKHGENVVFDEVANIQALVENPIWSIDNHLKWKKINEVKIENILGITKDDERGRVFIVTNHAIYTLSTETEELDTIPFTGGQPYSVMGKQIIFNKFTNELWSYCFNNSEINKFSFTSNKWSYPGGKDKEPDFWHHNRFISPVDSSLIALMGYGFYTYKSIINRYNEKSKNWEVIDCNEKIYPRYLSSSGFLNDREVLIFGGYGSKTGRQEVSPQCYYDLHSLNLDNYAIKKLWTLERPVSPFVPVEELIADKQSDCFYTLVYNRDSYETYLHLAKFGINESEYQFYNDSIPYSFLDIKSWSTLFLVKKSSKLIAITTHESDISLYTMAFPPLMPEDVYQQVATKAQWNILPVLAVSLAAVVIVVLFLIHRKRKGKITQGKIAQGEIAQGEIAQGEITQVIIAEQIKKNNITPPNPIERKTNNSIYFMGGFQIYNRNGQNITHSFSPTLKQLFLFIFMYTNKNGKGVSSQKLDEELWYDKIGESARNNRNVNISKLRTILAEMDGIELVNENSYWKLKMGEPIYCDYIEIFQLLSKSKSKSLTEAETNYLISLLLVGEFLPLVQTEWMDNFKSKFTNDITGGITLLFKEKEIKNNASLLYNLADCIFLHEPLNDDALAIKCTVFYNMGKLDRAKQTYDSFCKDYKKTLGIDYSISFKEIVNAR